MNFTFVLFLSIVAVSAFRGYRSGILIIAARVVSLALAYVAAILFSNSAATLLQKHTAIEGLIAYMVAGTLVFVITSILLSSLFSLLKRKFTPKSTETNRTSSVAGGLFGAVVGGIVGLMAVWFASTIQEILMVKKGQPIAKSSVFERTAKELTSKAIGGIVIGTTGDSDLAKGAAKLLSSPAQNIQHFNQLSQSGELRNLFQNPEVRSALDSQNPAALLNSTAFKRLSANTDFIALTNELNLTGSGSGSGIGTGTGEQKNKQLAIKLTSIWAQVKQVQNNPQYLEIVQDPEIKQMLQSGNAYKLLGSAKIERLLKIISSSKTPEITYQELNNQSAKPKEQKAIYRWVDQDGKVHYSDKKKQP